MMKKSPEKVLRTKEAFDNLIVSSMLKQLMGLIKQNNEKGLMKNK